MSKSTRNGVNGDNGSALHGTLRISDADALSRWPELIEMLQDRWQNNKLALRGCTIKISAATSLYKVELSSPGSKRKAVWCMDVLGTVFDELEKAIATDRIPWEPDFVEQKEARQRFGR